MTNAEIFHQATSRFGGRFQRDRAPEAVKRFYEEAEERAFDLIARAREVVPNTPEIHVDFILNGKINALAFKSHDRYFIGIYTGALFMLRSVIGRMLSDARLFRYAGDAKTERDDLGSLAGYVPDAEVMYKKESLSTPRDPVRRNYAHFLHDQAFMFLVGHELTHVLHGHIDYLRAKRGEKVTAELEWIGDGDEQTRIERQRIEMDADRRSIISRIDSIRLAVKNGDVGIAPWRPHPEDPGLMIFDWAISLNILFQLFGDLRFSQVEPAKSAYPPLPLRRTFCEASAREAVGVLWDPTLMKSATGALLLARRETDFSFATMLGEKFDADGVRKSFEQIDRNYGDKIVKYWIETLTERLIPYSYEQFPAPAVGVDLIAQRPPSSTYDPKDIERNR